MDWISPFSKVKQQQRLFKEVPQNVWLQPLYESEIQASGQPWITLIPRQDLGSMQFDFVDFIQNQKA